MKTFNLNSFIPTAVVAALLGALSPNDARGWSFGNLGSHGSWGSYGGWGSHGGYASFRGYGSYGSSGSYGSFGSNSYRSYASVGYGSYGSHGSSGQAFYYTPESPGMAPAPPPPVPPQAEAEPQATIHMWAPEAARVFVNDHATTSTGPERHFIARGLRPGETYAYRRRVEFEKDGENVVKNKRVALQAGDAIELDFADAEQLADRRNAVTELTVRVPKNAEVTLSGARTVQTGELRTYATSALVAGMKWDGYVVRVEIEQDGKTVFKERTLTLIGGEKHELAFDFAEESAALAAL